MKVTTARGGAVARGKRAPRRGGPRRPDLRATLAALRGHFGRLEPGAGAEGRDPFAMILWEQVAYLADDARRGVAFERLRAEVGLAPADVAKAPLARLRAIARAGGAIAASDRAARMRRSAGLALTRWGGDLARVLALPAERARRELARFPMIGEPGADRILAFCGAVPLVALDSHALRVVQRLGLAEPAADYARSYRAAREALAGQAPRTRTGRVEAALLLRRHGQEVCRSKAPLCTRCPLCESCPSSEAG